MTEAQGLSPLERVLSRFESDLSAEEIQRRIEQLSQTLLVDYAQHPLFSSDPNALFAEIRAQAPRQVCQYAFRKNDIVWICKTCQKDETCVQCNNCFNDSDHRDHDVFFYHSQAGGCCDCGDPDAWDPRGFCSKHGNVAQNPLEHLSPTTREVGARVLEQVASAFADHAESVVAQYNIHRLAQGSDERVMLVLHLDDAHRPDTLVHLFQHSEPAAQAVHDDSLRTNLISTGVLAERVDIASAVRRAEDLHSNSCVVRIATLQEWRREQLFQRIMEWLYRVAESSDGFCRLVCNAFRRDYLVRIMKADCRLPKALAKALHDLFLTLMADQTFKMSVAQAYARSFEVFTRDYAACIGTNDASLYTLSVQFLNRGSFVNEIVSHHMFLQALSGALRHMLLTDQASTSQHPILAFRRYNPIIGDLKCIFTIPQISRVFLGLCLHEWLETLSIVQGIHPQQRMLTHHVEYETREWMDAFNLYLGISSVFDYLSNWFGVENSAYDVVTDTTTLPSVQSVGEQICEALQRWQSERFSESWAYAVRTLQGGFTVYGAPQKLSFHLFLHRFLASILREATKHPRHSDTVQAVLDRLRSDVRQFMLTLDFPLLDIVWAAQIKSGMWRKNGQVMSDQLLNYSEPPFCRVFHDLDLIMVQFCAVALEPGDLLTHILFRYGIQDYVQQKSVERTVDAAYAPALLEEALSFMAVFVTELPPAPSDDVAERVVPTLRRELIHRLVGGPATYSQLQECLALVPDHEKLPSGCFDDIVAEVAEGREGNDLGPKKYYLREEHWSVYDPTFFHISTHAHQTAIEHRPKLKKPAPIVPPPLPAHPLFVPLRQRFLCSPSMIELVQHLLAKYISQHPSASTLYDVPRAWPINCTQGAFIHVLQLITLQIHELRSLNAGSTASRLKQEYFTGALDGLSAAPAPAAAASSTDDPEHAGFETDMAAESLPSLVCCLLDVYEFLDSKEDATTRFWLKWILTAMREMDGRCEALIGERWQASDSSDRAAALEAKKKRAKNKAMKAMKASAAAFAAQAAEFNLSDDDMETSPREGEDGKEDEEPFCIICHENNGQSLGYIALAQGSRLLNHREQRMHRAADADSYAQYPSPMDIYYQFCGHAIHFSCFATYFVSVVTKSESQNGLILDTAAREYQCPLCKALANTLVPHTASHQPRKRIRQDGEPSDWFSRCVTLLNGRLSESDSAEFAQHNEQVAVELRDWANRLPLAESDAHTSPLGDIPEEKEEAKLSTSLPDESVLSRGTGGSIRAFLRARSGSAASNGSQTASGGVRGTFSRLFRGRSMSAGSADSGSDMGGSPASPPPSTRRLLDFACEGCAPRLKDRAPSEARLGEYIETLCSAVAFTVSVEEVEEGLAHHLAPGFDKRDPLKMIGKVADAIGETVAEFKLTKTLWDVVRHKLARDPLNDQSSAQLPDTWDWLTRTPLLCANGLDMLVFALSFRNMLDDDATLSAAREVCMIRLAQLCVGEVRENTDSADGQVVDKRAQQEQWGHGDAQRFLVGLRELVQLTHQAAHHHPGNSSNPVPSHPVVQRIVYRWIVFMRTVAQILHRCRPGIVQAAPLPRPESVDSASWEQLLVHAALLRLPLPIVGDTNAQEPKAAQQLYQSRFTNWLAELGDDQQLWQACVQQANWHYPAETRPTLMDLPQAYTSLHSEMYRFCDYEFPALCLACGAVLDANGKGECTRHVAACSGSSGMVFLLQDCSILLLHGARACYYPAPYVDAHGERHRQFRGKPLFFDPRRYELLRQLWAGQNISREVVSKRSSSNRVIINSHY